MFSMKRRARLSDEELALWAHVAQSVKPLPGRRMPHYENPAAHAVVAAAPQEVMTMEAVASGRPSIKSPLPKVSAPKPLATMERRLRQRVTRGQAPIHGIIDLHGMRQEEAHRALLSFIQRKHHEGASVVMVITGKGSMSSDGSERGILKRMVPHWLSDPGLRRCVIGYEDAAHHHGGTGALYVRIRRIKD
jgi:DNA-nicking Smr family endonuclease